MLFPLSQVFAVLFLSQGLCLANAAVAETDPVDRLVVAVHLTRPEVFKKLPSGN